MATIAEEINNLKSRVTAAYDACESKGATIPSEKNSWNLSSTIESIPSGGGGPMPRLFGLPISAYVPLQDPDGVIHSPSYTTRTTLTIDAPNHQLVVADRQTLAWIAGLLAIPEPRSAVIHKTSQISSVDFAISSIWDIDSVTMSLTGALDSMFQGIDLSTLSVSLLQSNLISCWYGKKSPLYKGGPTKIGSLLYNAKVKELYLPKLQDYETEFHGYSTSPYRTGLEKFYAPNLSGLWGGVGESMFKSQNKLSSVTLADQVKLYNSGTISGFMDSCGGMTYIPMKTIVTPNAPNATNMFRNCSNISAVDLSVDRDTGTTPTTGQWTGAFALCSKLKTAKITYYTPLDADLSSSAAADKLSGMFRADGALERVDIYGINVIGLSTAVVANTCTEIMNGSKSGSQLWFHGLRTIIGYKSASATYQRWKNLGCKDLYLPDVSLIDQLYVFTGIGSATTGIHFSASHEAEIRASAGFATKWGAPDTCTIYFDL